MIPSCLLRRPRALLSLAFVLLQSSLRFSNFCRLSLRRIFLGRRQPILRLTRRVRLQLEWVLIPVRDLALIVARLLLLDLSSTLPLPPAFLPLHLDPPTAHDVCSPLSSTTSPTFRSITTVN